MLHKFCLSVTLLSLCFACNKAEEGGGDTAEKTSAAKEDQAEKKAEPKAKVAEKEWLKIEKFGVQLEVPKGAKPMPGAGSSLMISGPDGGCTVMLAKKDDMSHFPSYDSTMKTIEKGVTGKKKEMLINEKKDGDNWVIHYTKAGMIDPKKTQHAVDVRAKIGDDLFSCSRVTDKEADAQCILHACQSLKKL